MASTTETPGPRRRRLAISLRALMILVLIVGGLLGWRANRAYTQRQAVARIIAGKGSLTYDFQKFPPNTPRATIQAAKTPGPAWLKRWLGDEYFQEVIGVSFSGPVTAESMRSVGTLDHLESIYIKDSSKIGDGLDSLRGLTCLKRVNITGPAVTDAWLADLAKCTDLELIWFVGADISDAGLAHLAGLPKLKVFNLSNTPRVTDATVENVVPTLPALVALDLDGSGITDKALTIMDQKTNLEELDLSRTKLTDAGIALLKDLTHLRSLTLNDLDLSDRGLEPLERLTQLTNLQLDRTGITDDGLAHLGGMTELLQLNLRGTKVNGSGFAHLAKLQKLHFLMLDSSDFTDAGMPFLAKLVALQTLFLSRTQVSDDGLRVFQGGTKLGNVVTSSSRITDAGYAAFRRANPTVKMGSNKAIPASRPADPKPKRFPA